LRGRLARRGLALAAAAVAETLAEEATAAVPPALLTVTAQAAGVFAADPTAVAGAVSPAAAELARGALRTMSISKMRMAVMVLMTVAVIGGGAGVVGRQVLAKPADPPKTGSAPAKPDEKPAVAAPGKGAAEFPTLALSTPQYAEKLNLGGGTRSIYRITLTVKFDGKGG